MKNLFVLFLLLSQTAISQYSDDLTFNISKEDKNYLRYFQLTNNFDSASVQYELGEFRIVTSSSKKKLVFQSTFDETKILWGDSVQGEDVSLRAKIKTNQFILPANAQLKFFRNLASFLPCDIIITTPEEPDQGGDGTWRDRWWLVGKGRILDKSEFVLQLVRASDNLVIAVLDSVGVDTNPNSNLAQRYGINPTQMNHVVDLPSAYANTDCYLRLSPRRWGPTPYGMELQVIRSWISRSDFNEYDSLNFYKYDSDPTDEVDSIYIERLVTFCDSIKQVDGWIGDNSYEWIFPTDYSNTVFLDRYHTEDSVLHNGSYIKIYHEKPDSIFQKQAEIFTQRSSPNKLRFAKMNTEISDNLSWDIEIFAPKDISGAKIIIYTVSGTKVKTFNSNLLLKGSNKFNFSLSGISNGMYFAILYDDHGVICDTRKIIVN